MSEIVSLDGIQQKILFMRGQRVMLDTDLALIYGVSTKRLNEQVKRNRKRFPADFMYRLNKKEYENLKPQNATSSWGGRRSLPYVFTEHGAIMLANVLNSPASLQASIKVVRAFVKLREMLASHAELARKLNALEKTYDAQFKVVFGAIKQLMAPPEKKSRKIGFKRDKEQ